MAADYAGHYPPAAAYPPADPYAASYAGYGAPAPYPPYAVPPAADEVRTVYISGFPDDVKEREVNNLLRFLPGYEASQMNRLKGQPQGFALFVNGAHARAAIDAIQHLRFDESSTLRCEMARKNMYIREEPSQKRARYAPGDPYGVYPPVGPPAGTGPPSGGYGTGLVKNTLDNPPCSTLFIGNLSDTVNEAELQTFFSAHPGYRQLKLTTGFKGNINCFVEFEDVESAKAVHTSQQGATLTSSSRGGIRIQYSKNPLGRKRDATGAEILGPPGVN